MLTTAPPQLTPSARLVMRVSRWLDRTPAPAPAATGPTRRSFLARAALVGTALATNPVQFLLRPGTAYAQTTGCGDSPGPGSGWTVFCVSVNGNRGKNTCPPGSYAAGWWKADNSSFCTGRARYYIDCNRLPSQPGACSCVNPYTPSPASCDRRAFCCNNFRYGQCNLQIGGVTPVVCRVISCTPPWEWDPSCTTTSRTDNRTESHTAPELAPRNSSAITIRYQDLGLLGSFLGARSGGEYDIAGGRQGDFTGGSIVSSSATGARALGAGIRDRWTAIGGSAAAIGLPTSDERAVGDGRGRFATFQGGRIYFTSATGAREIQPPLLADFIAAGGTTGALGYPISGMEFHTPARVRVRFEGGTLEQVRLDRYVESVYRSVVLRLADAGGLNAWVTAMVRGQSRAALAQSLFDSYEGRARHVDQAYLDYLGRPADATGRAGYANYLGTGKTWRDLAISLLTSGEVWSSAGSTPAGYVDLLYLRLLGRPSDPGGQAGWVQFLATQGRAATAAAFFDSTEALRRRVDIAYRRYLGRGADPTGREAYVAIARSSGDRTVAISLMSSIEYLQRCATVPFGAVELVQRAGLNLQVRVRGWAIDPETTAAVEVRVLIDGAQVSATTANAARPDVGAANAAYGPNHGFDHTFLYNTAGTHEVSVLAVDASSGATIAIGGGTIT